MSSPSSLRDLVSSSLKRQNLTATVPAAMRFIPLGALAAGELLERHVGSTSVTDMLLGKDQTDDVLVLGGVEEMISNVEGRGEFRIMSCTVCSGGLALQRLSKSSISSYMPGGNLDTTVLRPFLARSKMMQFERVE